MKKKPKGYRYRNLFARGNTITYEWIKDGRRIKRTLGTDDWALAAQIRDELEAKLGTSPLPCATVPTFRDVAADVLKVGMEHLAPSTRDDRRKLLREGGPITDTFGSCRVDAISRADLLTFWENYVIAGGRSPPTGVIGQNGTTRTSRESSLNDLDSAACITRTPEM